MKAIFDISSKLAGVIIGIIAVVAFISSIADDREARRADNVNSWRKAAIHKVLQDNSTKKLEIKAILSEIRNLAWNQAKLDINKDELSEQEIRILLLEMISLGLVNQNSDETHELRFALKTTSIAAEIIGKDVLKGVRFRIALLNKLKLMPGKYPSETIFNDIAKPTGIDRIEYNTILKILQNTGTIVIDEQGMVKLRKTDN